MNLELSDLEGKWYIHYSDFPMWLKGDKLYPTFNYKVGKRDGNAGLHDEVVYEKKGRQKRIVGFDTPTDPGNTTFVWRGNGLLSLLKSKWEILHLDAEQQWAIIHFQKTLFTPEGYDVISREKWLGDRRELEIRKQLKVLGIDALLVRIRQ